MDAYTCHGEGLAAGGCVAGRRELRQQRLSLNLLQAWAAGSERSLPCCQPGFPCHQVSQGNVQTLLREAPSLWTVLASILAHARCSRGRPPRGAWSLAHPGLASC